MAGNVAMWDRTYCIGVIETPFSIVANVNANFSADGGVSLTARSPDKNCDGETARYPLPDGIKVDGGRVNI